MQHADPSAPSDESVVEGEWGDPRKWSVRYVAFTAVVSMVYIWSISVSGMKLLPWLVGALGWVAVVVVWCVIAVWTAVRLVRRSTRRVPVVLAIIPVIGVGVVAARVTEAPLHLRFDLARDEMTAYAEQVMESAPAPSISSTGGPLSSADVPEAPESIGGIDISYASVVPGGLLLYDTDGFFLDDAGYAYLPDGEFPPSTGWLERPRFRSLGGGWYAFTASW